jgi:hypothetical protein
MLVVRKSFALIIYLLITFPCLNPHLSVIDNTFHEILVYNSDNESVNVAVGARGGVVVKALRYKPAGRGFDYQWCRWNFSVT